MQIKFGMQLIILDLASMDKEKKKRFIQDTAQLEFSIAKNGKNILLLNVGNQQLFAQK
jgi:hypothetical protein